jgi:low temperature requirement protein LtrA
MTGRDPHESGRVATTLELLFDLTFVIAYGIAAGELAHFLAEDHIASGLLGFGFATFAVTWAWINFSWFASAYDTDDWKYRLTTLVQMVGVLIVALGIPAMYASIERGGDIDNTVIVFGYIVMRVAMVSQWLRAAAQDPVRRSACLTYAAFILIAQVGWVGLMVSTVSLPTNLICAGALALVEMAGPWVAERRKGGTPWHPHHIAERYGLLVIICLGESLIGTIAAMGVIIGPDGSGFSAEFVAMGMAGVSLTFGMWWVYFVIPHGDVLHKRPERSFGWGYGHMLMFGSIVAIGAGLHAAAYYLDHHSKLSASATVATVAIPLAIFVAALFVLYLQLTRTFDAFHLLLLAGSAAVIVASMLSVMAGVPVGWSLVILSFTPWITVVGYELVGHRHNAEMLAQL